MEELRQNQSNVNDKTSLSGNESNLDSSGIVNVSDLPAQISNKFNATSWKLQDIQNIMAGINGIVQDKQLMERYFGGVFAKNDSTQQYNINSNCQMCAIIINSICNMFLSIQFEISIL